MGIRATTDLSTAVQCRLYSIVEPEDISVVPKVHVHGSVGSTRECITSTPSQVPKFLYTIPTGHNPTGRTLPTERREKLADLAHQSPARKNRFRAP